eukprot:CAMPEP_0173384678 /NCGR_PEP_ID=MMETSP1356-20130122/7254_1 /TAXON_ID=77927 ORGANISM="Hemiselmis virescens, Strain PCC157" /NCGR_SAMPLE_ID=MMETSP1356 /ASSEMBLY_ACC=CAM_ASM_000847 /LENGTH=31 /DNA_ID= /DNA_START= /DNA_END= /DNA_ORIENTATION=
MTDTWDADVREHRHVDADCVSAGGASEAQKV